MRLIFNASAVLLVALIASVMADKAKPPNSTTTEVPPCGECAFGNCPYIKDQKPVATAKASAPDKDGHVNFPLTKLLEAFTTKGTTTNASDPERLTLTVDVKSDTGCFIFGLTDEKAQKPVEEYAAHTVPSETPEGIKCNKVFKLPITTTTKLQVWKLPLGKDYKCPRDLLPPYF